MFAHFTFQGAAADDNLNKFLANSQQGGEMRNRLPAVLAAGSDAGPGASARCVRGAIGGARARASGGASLPPPCAGATRAGARARPPRPAFVCHPASSRV